MVQVVKPSWLVNFLNACNWTILGINIYPGYYIESAIDWVLYYVNYSLELGLAAWNYAASIYDWLGTEFNSIAWQINNIWYWLMGQAQDVWYAITDWWTDTYPIVLSWINNSVYEVKIWALGTIEHVKAWVADAFVTISQWTSLPSIIGNWLVEHLGTGWLNFWNEVVSFFTSTVPKTWPAFKDALNNWATERGWTDEARAKLIAESEVAPVKSTIEIWQGVIQNLKDFFADPLGYLANNIDWSATLSDYTSLIETQGGTPERRDAVYAEFPTVEKQIAEEQAILGDEKLIVANPIWGMIEVEMEKIKAVLAAGRGA